MIIIEAGAVEVGAVHAAGKWPWFCMRSLHTVVLYTVEQGSVHMNPIGVGRGGRRHSAHDARGAAACGPETHARVPMYLWEHRA